MSIDTIEERFLEHEATEEQESIEEQDEDEAQWAADVLAEEGENVNDLTDWIERAQAARFGRG